MVFWRISVKTAAMTQNNFQSPLGQNGSIHPDDKRNLLIFFVICLALFYGYNHFVQKPQAEAAKALQAQQQAVAAQRPLTATPNAPETIQTVDAALGGETRLPIEGTDLTGSINLQGLRFDDARLKTYFEDLKNTQPVRLLAPARTDSPQFFDIGWVNAGTTAVELPNAETVWKVEGEAKTLTPETPVTVTWQNPQQVLFKVTFTLDQHYMVGVTQLVENKGKQAVVVAPYTSVARHGQPKVVSAGLSHDGPMGYIAGQLEQATYKNLEKEPLQNFSGQAGWIGIAEKYWFAGLATNETTAKTYRIAAVDGAFNRKNYQSDITGAPVEVAAGAVVSSASYMYVGPKKLALLNGYEKSLNIPRFDLVIDFGWLWFLTIPFFHLLTWLGQVFGNFAVALLVFTVIVRIATFPLANKSYRSFARMRKVAPQMKEIQERHKNDREKLQKSIFELYQREKVNPMAGCFPILVQIPIFFALYRVLSITIEMRHQPFWGWIADMSAPDPTSVFNLFGMIPWQTPALLTIGVWPILMGITFYLQQLMSPPIADPTQRFILKFMPVFMVLTMAHFPAGLVIYWTWSNALSIVQQYVLMRSEGVDPHIWAELKKRFGSKDEA